MPEQRAEYITTQFQIPQQAESLRVNALKALIALAQLYIDAFNKIADAVAEVFTSTTKPLALD